MTQILPVKTYSVNHTPGTIAISLMLTIATVGMFAALFAPLHRMKPPIVTVNRMRVLDRMDFSIYLSRQLDFNYSNNSFYVMPFTVTPLASYGGTISPLSPQPVNFNDSIAFTATPCVGYVVNGWRNDSGGMINAGTLHHTLSDISIDHVVEVYFSPAHN